MARRKLPLLAERSLAQVKADRIQLADELDAKLPIVSCKPGCASCCSYPVYISILEGMLLYRHLTEKGHWSPTFRQKLQAHDKQTYDMASEVWVLLEIPCPLLEQKTRKCLAYQARPFSCRTLYATTDASLCSPRRMMSAAYVERASATSKFREVETALLANHKLGLIGLTISKAVLLAEKIMTGEAELEQFVRVALESLREARP
jgi:Fe-S-cluster containining protein